jgi:uncharacterized protein (DUF433 family)
MQVAGVIIKDLNILGGEPVFRGTRVPFKVLIDYLEGGDTLDEFLEQYPSVSRELAITACSLSSSSRIDSVNRYQMRSSLGASETVVAGCRSAFAHARGSLVP